MRHSCRWPSAVQKKIWEAPRTQATTARGTDAARTEEAAPVVLVVVADAAGLVAPVDKDAGWVAVMAGVVAVAAPVVEPVAFPVVTWVFDDPDSVVGRSGGMKVNDTVAVAVP